MNHQQIAGLKLVKHVRIMYFFCVIRLILLLHNLTISLYERYNNLDIHKDCQRMLSASVSGVWPHILIHVVVMYILHSLHASECSTSTPRTSISFPTQFKGQLRLFELQSAAESLSPL